MGRPPAPTLSSRQGRLTAYRLIRELRDRLCDAVDPPNCSVMVATFYLVRGGFLGVGTGVLRNKYEGPGVLPGRYAGEAETLFTIKLAQPTENQDQQAA